MVCPHCAKSVKVPEPDDSRIASAPKRSESDTVKAPPASSLDTLYQPPSLDAPASPPVDAPTPTVAPPAPSASETVTREETSESAVDPPADKQDVPPDPVEKDVAASRSLHLSCPKCDQQFRVARTMAGEVVVCPFCESKTRVPAGLEGEDHAQGESPAESAENGATRNAEEATDKNTSQAVDSEDSLESDSHGAEPELSAAGTPIIHDDGVRRLQRGDKVIEIRRLSPAERTRRRFRKNMIMLVLGAAILTAALIYFTHYGL